MVRESAIPAPIDKLCIRSAPSNVMVFKLGCWSKDKDVKVPGRWTSSKYSVAGRTTEDNIVPTKFNILSLSKIDKSKPPTKLATRFNTSSCNKGAVIVIPVGRNSTTSFPSTWKAVRRAPLKLNVSPKLLSVKSPMERI